MKKKIFNNLLLSIILIYLAFYTFWHAFFGPKNIFISSELKNKYLFELQMLKEYKATNIFLENRIDCLNLKQDKRDLVDQKIKEIGFLEGNEIVLSNFDE